MAQAPTSAPFHYLEDKSVFGQYTPPRNAEVPFSRKCGGWTLVPCPGSPGYANASGVSARTDNYDTSIPPNVMEAFQSGLSVMQSSVSSVFDIQSRYTATQSINDSSPVGNGTGYPVSQLRPIQSRITDRGYHLVEGLVVDRQAGGVGFRNHTAPTWRPLGSKWTEELLFIVPEAHCVDLNLTMDYRIYGDYANLTNVDTNMVLTDRGGFVNFTKEFAPYNWTTMHSQDDPELSHRAFNAASVSNLLAMAFMNVTNLEPYNFTGFRYLDSHLEKRFPLLENTKPKSLEVAPLYGSYLSGADIPIGETNFNNSDSRNTTKNATALYENPFNITTWDFTEAGKLLAFLYTSCANVRRLTSSGPVCTRTTSVDYANISNIHVHCGMIYGVPQRQTPGDSIMFDDPGSNWSVPLYSCAAGAKATIKTVSFAFNGSDDLSGLRVTDVKPKKYSDESSKPLWGVENTRLLLQDTNPLWGLVTPESASKLGLSTLRKDHLWLPGQGGFLTMTPEFQNLPGAYFYGNALSGLFSPTSNAFFDYTGGTSVSLLLQWQNLSQTAAGTAQALNLIWTDIAANYVLGTRSIITTDAENGVPDVSVVFYASRIRFHIIYGIPAFLTLAMVLLVCVLTLVSILVQGSGPRRMTKFSNWTSTGRIFTSLEQDSDGNVIYLSSKPSKAWTKEEGKHDITVRDQSEGQTAEPKPELEHYIAKDMPEDGPAQQRLLRASTPPS